MPTDPEIGGPSADDRQQVYAQMQLSAQRIRHIENMITESGSREVGKSALTNVRVRHQSIKNGKSRLVESHTCELVYAYELEFDPDVLGYYVQVSVDMFIEPPSTGARMFLLQILIFLFFAATPSNLLSASKLRG